MLSNLTLAEIKIFFKGNLISELKDERFYVYKVQGIKYCVKDRNYNKLGFIYG